MRTTRKHLEGSLEVLNELCNRPKANPLNGEWVDGHISYENWGGSYFISESVGSGGKHLSPSGTLREAHQWVCAAIAGIQLSRGQHYGR